MAFRATLSSLLAVLGGIAAAGAVHPVAAQDPPAADSVATLARLRDAQDAFEALRRRRLPPSRAFRAGDCDEEIGRICFWHEDDPRWDPPPEDERTTAARRDLLRALALGAEAHPGDRWIVGQRVRYLVEDGNTPGALAAARECQVSAWWCGALEGFVGHTGGDYAAADAAFDVALRLSPDSVRCDWTDLSPIMGPDSPRGYRDVACDDRAGGDARLWWLADPLYSVPGNDRRTEHFARLVMIALLADAAIPSGMSWDRGQEEILLRYGWTVGWSLDRSSSGTPTGTVIGHHRRGSRHFLPPARILDDPAEATFETWEIDVPRPFTRYAPTYAAVFGRLAPELTLFARGDSVALVTAFSVAIADAARTVTGPFVVAVVYQEGHAGPLLLETDTIPAGGIGRFTLTVPRRGGLIDVEALSRTDSVAARARFWLAVDSLLPPGRPSVGLLIVESTGTLPRSLPEASRKARPSTDYLPGEPITVYWETAEFPPGSRREVSLTVVREAGGFLRRAASWLGLASRERTEVTLGWEENDPLVGGAPGRAVTFEIPEAREAEYRIRLTARTDAVTAATERTIRVRR